MKIQRSPLVYWALSACCWGLPNSQGMATATSIFSAEFVGRFQYRIDRGCTGEAPVVLAYCKENIEVLSTSNYGLTCEAYDDSTGLGWSAVECQDTYCSLEEENCRWYAPAPVGETSIGKIPEDDYFAEIHFKCSGTTREGVDAFFVYQSGQEDGTCVVEEQDDTTTMNNRTTPPPSSAATTRRSTATGLLNYHVAQLGVYCGKEDGSYTFEEESFFCPASNGKVETEEGNYYCYSGANCTQDWNVTFHKVEIYAEADSFEEDCILLADGNEEGQKNDGRSGGGGGGSLGTLEDVTTLQNVLIILASAISLLKATFVGCSGTYSYWHVFGSVVELFLTGVAFALYMLQDFVDDPIGNSKYLYLLAFSISVVTEVMDVVYTWNTVRLFKRIKKSFENDAGSLELCRKFGSHGYVSGLLQGFLSHAIYALVCFALSGFDPSHFRPAEFSSRTFTNLLVVYSIALATNVVAAVGSLPGTCLDLERMLALMVLTGIFVAPLAITGVVFMILSLVKANGDAEYGGILYLMAITASQTIESSAETSRFTNLILFSLLDDDLRERCVEMGCTKALRELKSGRLLAQLAAGRLQEGAGAETGR